jgi:hypothetical protein
VEGDDCHADLGCRAGLVCDLSACPGSCVPPAARPPVGVVEGGGCGDDVGACTFGLQCFGGVCVRPRALGTPCGDGRGPCEEYRTYCDTAGAEDGSAVCVELPTAGAACGLGKSARCSASTCDPAFGLCFTPPRSSGAACDPATPEVCDSWECGEDGLCEPIRWPFPACPVPVDQE